MRGNYNPKKFKAAMQFFFPSVFETQFQWSKPRLTVETQFSGQNPVLRSKPNFKKRVDFLSTWRIKCYLNTFVYITQFVIKTKRTSVCYSGRNLFQSTSFFSLERFLLCCRNQIIPPLAIIQPNDDLVSLTNQKSLQRKKIALSFLF